VNSNVVLVVVGVHVAHIVLKK